MQKELVSAKEMAQRLHISYGAINNYTDMGILDVVARRNGMRMYDYKKAKQRLVVLSRMSSEGYPLRMIARILK